MPAYSQKTADAIAASGIPMSADYVQDAGRMTAEREAEIRERVATRGAELTAWMNAHSPTPGQEVIGHAESVLEEDVPELLDELAAVRKERDEAKAALERRTEDLAFLERATLPELRRTIQHHEDGKKRWRDRAEKAEAEAYQYRTALQGAARKAERDNARRDELKRQATQAIFALKSPAPPGSEHYRSGWDDGLEAAIDAARDALGGDAS